MSVYSTSAALDRVYGTTRPISHKEAMIILSTS